MASKITLYDSTGNPVELDGDMIKKALPTAWVNFTGTGAVGTNMVINGSYNILSVYHVSTGKYDVTFLVPMDNANYTFAAEATQSATGTGMVTGYIGSTLLTTAKLTFLFTGASTNVARAVDIGMVTIFGGKN